MVSLKKKIHWVFSVKVGACNSFDNKFITPFYTESKFNSFAIKLLDNTISSTVEFE